MMIKNDVNELKSDLERFKFDVQRLCELEDKLILINIELSGDTLKSPSIKSKQEAFYQAGTPIYHNNIAALMYQEEQLIKSRDYYLYRVRKVSEFLQTLTPEEVQLLEYRYWFGFSIRTISKATYTSKSSVCRNIDAIFEKWDMSQQF